MFTLDFIPVLILQEIVFLIQHIPKNDCVDCQKVGVYHNKQTILVMGFESLRLPQDQVKNMFRDLFGSCGEITTLTVPINYKTGFPMGFGHLFLSNFVTT